MTAALLLFLAGFGLGALIGCVVTWRTCAAALRAQRATHQQVCCDIERITNSIRARLDIAEMQEMMAFHVPLNQDKRGQTRTGE